MNTFFDPVNNTAAVEQLNKELGKDGGRTGRRALLHGDDGARGGRGRGRSLARYGDKGAAAVYGIRKTCAGGR